MTEDDFIHGAPLRFRILGTVDRYATAVFHPWRQGMPPHLVIQEEGAHHRLREPVMGEHEARAFYNNSTGD